MRESGHGADRAARVATGDRIALAVPLLAAGGAERVILNLAHALVDEGVGVDIVVLREEGEFLDEARAIPGVRLVVLGAARSTTSAFALARYLRREAPFAIVPALYTLTLSCIVAARLSGYRGRVVSTIHNTIGTAEAAAPSVASRAMLAAMRMLLPWSDAVVAVSRGVAEDLPRSLGIAPDRVHVIYNPVVSPALFEAATQPPAHPWLAARGLPVIVGIGRLVPQKDFPTLLRAFRLLRDEFPCRLVILGEGPDRLALTELARELGIADDLDLPGFVANPYSVLANASAFVLSSRWEGLPTVLIEALALGVPLVATDCPSGPREILDHGRLGRLTPVGDPQALALAIKAQLGGERDAEAGRAASKPYTFRAAARAYLALARGEDPRSRSYTGGVLKR